MKIVEFNNVSKRRKDFIMSDLNIHIPKGFMTGLIGPNGSGKTTIIQLMMNVIQPDEGDIQIFGKSHKDSNIKQNIGFVYDDFYMYDEFTIKQVKSFVAPIYHHWDEDLYQKYVQKFQLPERKKIKHFSKGMKMKGALLFALAHQPEFLVMDEPTAGLDPVFRRELFELLQELMINEDQTICMATHITTDIDHIADHIILMHEGKVLLQKDMEEIREQYHLVKGKTHVLDEDTRKLFLGLRENAHGFTALYQGEATLFNDLSDDLVIEQATLEDLLYFLT